MQNQFFHSKTSGNDSKNEGQPVPLSNFDLTQISLVPQPTQ